MEKIHRSRRKLIKILVLAVVSLPLLGKFLMLGIQQRKSLLRVKKKDIPGSGALVSGEKKIAVIKEGPNVFALSLTCTHLGCMVNTTSKGFACPCHGSVFNTRGEVIRGPADRPLKRLAVEEDGNDVLIRNSQ